METLPNGLIERGDRFSTSNTGSIETALLLHSSKRFRLTMSARWAKRKLGRPAGYLRFHVSLR